MKKLNIINEIKGIAFVLMLIHHMFYFYDVSKDYKTQYSKNTIIQICGIISRHIFILLVHILFIFTLYEIKEKPVLFIVPSVPAVIAAAVILYRI